MKKSLIAFVILMLFITTSRAEELKFTDDMIIGKTFYISEQDGYDTIAKYYLDDNEIKLFYVIFFNGQLEETDTLDADIDELGRIKYVVFNRPTALELLSQTNKEYVVKEYHSGKPANTLILQLSKPEKFAIRNDNKDVSK